MLKSDKCTIYYGKTTYNLKASYKNGESGSCLLQNKNIDSLLYLFDNLHIEINLGLQIPSNTTNGECSFLLIGKEANTEIPIIKNNILHTTTHLHIHDNKIDYHQNGKLVKSYTNINHLNGFYIAVNGELTLKLKKIKAYSILCD